jgi:hypothetical protein
VGWLFVNTLSLFVNTQSVCPRDTVVEALASRYCTDALPGGSKDRPVQAQLRGMSLEGFERNGKTLPGPRICKRPRCDVFTIIGQCAAWKDAAEGTLCVGPLPAEKTRWCTLAIAMRRFA